MNELKLNLVNILDVQPVDALNLSGFYKSSKRCKRYLAFVLVLISYISHIKQIYEATYWRQRSTS